MVCASLGLGSGADGDSAKGEPAAAGYGWNLLLERRLFREGLLPFARLGLPAAHLDHANVKKSRPGAFIDRVQLWQEVVLRWLARSRVRKMCGSLQKR